MKVNPANDARIRAIEQLRYRNKQEEIKRMEDKLRQERLMLKQMKFDDGKGQNVDLNA